MNEQEKLIKKSDEHAKKVGIKLNPNKKELDHIIKGLLLKKKKHGRIYCPCRVITCNKENDKEIICPCVFHRGEIELKGKCLCQLFIR